MSQGCCAVEHSGPIPVCPTTGNQTKPVGRRTLEALLTPEAKAALTPQPYYFCDVPECDVVYVSALGDHLITKDHLTVRVGVKEKDDPAPLCYCFGYDRKTILDEVRAKGSTDIPKVIAGRVKAGECRCEVTNPSGGCCLGSIHRAIRENKSHEACCPTPAPAKPAPGKAGWLGTGALVTGLLASLCCIGPVVLGALGLGTVALGAGLDKFRPVFAIVTAALLAGAFYFVYRKREVACEDGSCRMESSGRGTKIGLWIVTVLTAGAFAFPYLRPARSGAAALGPGEREVRMTVANMTCQGCAFNIQKALERVPGVKSAAVDFEGKAARAVVAEVSVKPETLVKAVEEIGYRATVAR